MPQIETSAITCIYNLDEGEPTQITTKMHGSHVLLLTNVTSHKSDHQLLGFAALTSGLGDNILVEHLHCTLETGKLHHGIGDLPHPQWHHTLIESIEERLSFFSLIQRIYL